MGVRRLIRNGNPGIPWIADLAAALQDPTGKGSVAQEAARALGRIGPSAQSAIPALVKLMETPDAAVPTATTYGERLQARATRTEATPSR